MAERDAILDYLDDLMDKPAWQDYLPIGLMVEGRPHVARVATAVSACMEVFRAAHQWGADMLLVHHGLFWKNEDPVLRGHHKQRVKFLLEHDITLAGYHLPLDAHPELGNNILFARALGLEDIQPFGDYKGRTIGYQGRLAPETPQAFAARARDFYGLEPRAAFLQGPPQIRSVAVVSGGAWDLLPQAAHAGIDCFVTGAADEPVYHLAREEAMHFFAFGHYATERVGIRRLGETLAGAFDLETRFFDVDNPL